VTVLTNRSATVPLDIAILQAMVTSVTEAIMVTLVTKVDVNVSNLFDFNHTCVLSTGV